MKITDQAFLDLFDRPDLMTESELQHELKAHLDAQKLSSAALDTLRALLERGPLGDGDVPSKSGRDELLEIGAAEKIVVNGEDGYQAATYYGRDVYQHTLLDSEGKVPTSLSKAFLAREANAAVERIRNRR